MSSSFQFVVQHGYPVLFLWVLLEQAGLPIPAIPILLAAGALVGTGHMNIFAALALAVFGSLLADFAWYQLGKTRGMTVLNFLCRISLEPDTCVRQTEFAFNKHGMKSLLFSKFIPGFSTAAPPLAGVFGMSAQRFVLFDIAGTVIWSGTFMLLGFIFTTQIEQIAAGIEQVGGSILKFGLISLALYIFFKWIRLRLVIRELRVMRIEPKEVKEMMERGDELFIVDLRSQFDYDTKPHTIKGALRMSPAEIREKHSEIPRDKDIILYCT
jgi:membrane protein DedA with SNARE-associated domain